MDSSDQEAAVDRYARKLQLLQKKEGDCEQKVLDVLIARDVLHKQIVEGDHSVLNESLRISQLDERLRSEGSRIAKIGMLGEWRKSFVPAPEAWWWHFKTPVHWTGQFEWIWNALTVTFLTVSLAFLVDTSARFLSHGPDTAGALAIAVQAVLTLLSGSSVFTQSGRDALAHIYTSFAIPKRFWRLVGAGLAFGVLCVVFFIHLALPRIAIAFNDRGLQDYEVNRLGSALADYQRAIALDPNYVEAHYNLGLLFEDLGQLDSAKSEYKFVVQSTANTSNFISFLRARNNLGRLHILTGDSADAALQLNQGLNEIGEFRTFVQLTKQEDFEQVNYALLKNLGWLRLQQERYSEANAVLLQAILLDSEPAAAHCLSAQAMDELGPQDAALAAWERCLQKANAGHRDEDVWIGMARDHLAPKGETQ